MSTEPVKVGRARAYGRLDDEKDGRNSNPASKEQRPPKGVAICANGNSGKARAYGRLNDDTVGASPNPIGKELQLSEGDTTYNNGDAVHNETRSPGLAGANGQSAPEIQGPVETLENNVDTSGPSATKDNSANRWAYMLFVIFGAGSSWLVVNAIYIELAIYQDRFGLITSNRMTIGYDLGTLAIPVYAMVREMLRRRQIGVNYHVLIPVINIVHFGSLLWSAIGVSSLEQLMFLNFLGGACGYLAGIVHQSYLLMRFESIYSAAFWGGDAAAGVVAAFVAMVQQPDKKEAERRFSPSIFYLVLSPMFPLSLWAFAHIERNGIGALPRETSDLAISGAAGEFDDDDEESEEFMDEAGAAPAPANARAASSTNTAKTSVDGGRSEEINGTLRGVELADAPLPTPTLAPESAPPHVGDSPSATGEGGTENRDAAATSELQRSPTSARRRRRGCRRFAYAFKRSLPTGVQRHLSKTTILVFIVFWSQFANWGIVDSITPYSCANASPHDMGDACVFQSAYGTIFGGVLGINLAAMWTKMSMRSLLVPFLIYSIPFPVVWFASSNGGRWADPWLSDGESSNLGGPYIALLISIMRTFGPMVRVMVTMLVQVEYEAQEFESMNFFLTSIGTASNFAGVMLATYFLEDE